MAWTESRSREEWLAEVKRRGGRIRRRRQMTFALAGVLALVLPVTALATFLGDPDRGVEVSVAGPPAGDVAPDTRVNAPSQPAPPEEPTTTTTTAEVHERIAVGNGPAAPPADDPVVRRTTTTIPARVSGPPPSTTVPPEPPAPLVPCVATEFGLKISVEKASYRPGETVKGSSVLEKRSAGTCLLPQWWVEIGFVNAAGKDVAENARSSGSGSIANQAENWKVETCREGECRRPVEPGAVFTFTFEWETLDCTGPAPGPLVPPPGDTSWCVTFPSGAYAVVADWVGPESGPDARMTFQIGVA